MPPGGIAQRTDEAALPSDAEAYRERYFALRQENEYLRRRLIEIESDLTGPQTIANGLDELEKLKEENERLQNRLAALMSTESDESTNELAAQLHQLDEERAALAMENEWLKRELENDRAEKPAAAAQSTGAPEILQKMHEGLARERAGDFTAALNIYEQILAARPSYAEALKAQGRCFLRLGKFEEAIAVFRDVAMANRNDALSRVLLGVAYCLAEKYNLAIDVLTPLVVNDPSNARRAERHRRGVDGVGRYAGREGRAGKSGFAGSRTGRRALQLGAGSSRRRP